jgi:hypothetical protein
MRKKQNGITFIGWIVLLVPFAVIGYAVVRLVPKYLTYFAVSRSLTELAEEFGGDPQVTVSALKNSLGKHLDIESIEFPTINDISFMREDGVWVAEANYQDSVPLFAGISLTVDFDKRVSIK